MSTLNSKQLIAIAKELNQVLGLEPAIKTVAVKADVLEEAIKESAAEIDYENDEFTDETIEGLTALGVWEGADSDEDTDEDGDDSDEDTDDEEVEEEVVTPVPAKKGKSAPAPAPAPEKKGKKQPEPVEEEDFDEMEEGPEEDDEEAEDPEVTAVRNQIVAAKKIEVLQGLAKQHALFHTIKKSMPNKINVLREKMLSLINGEEMPAEIAPATKGKEKQPKEGNLPVAGKKNPFQKAAITGPVLAAKLLKEKKSEKEMLQAFIEFYADKGESRMDFIQSRMGIYLKIAKTAK